MLYDIANAFLQTIYLVFITSIPVVLIGMCIGILHLSLNHKSLIDRKKASKVLSLIVNSAYNLPYIVLLIIFIPVGKYLSSVYDAQAGVMVPIILAALPVFVYKTTTALSKTNENLISMAEQNGATRLQILTKVILPESWRGILEAYGATLIALVSCSTIAGIMGANGLGRLLIEKGYRSFHLDYLIGIVIALAVLNYLIKTTTQKLTANV
jgi:D-methionine transport system permease protein